MRSTIGTWPRNSARDTVDRVSFELMRHRGVGQAFAFDRDFRAAGFSTVP